MACQPFCLSLDIFAGLRFPSRVTSTITRFSNVTVILLPLSFVKLCAPKHFHGLKMPKLSRAKLERHLYSVADRLRQEGLSK